MGHLGDIFSPGADGDPVAMTQVSGYVVLGYGLLMSNHIHVVYVKK